LTRKEQAFSHPMMVRGGGGKVLNYNYIFVVVAYINILQMDVFIL
jgi:hypothetical protein